MKYIRPLRLIGGRRVTFLLMKLELTVCTIPHYPLKWKMDESPVFEVQGRGKIEGKFLR